MELNGRKYDAQTGMPLPHTAISASKAQSSHSPHHSIDGFVKKSQHAPRKIADTKLAHHEPVKSSTLMRKSVKKPTPITHIGQRVSKFKEVFLRPEVSPIDGNQQLAPAKQRLDRANLIKRSKLINRFGAEIAPTPAAHYASHKASHIALQAVSQPITDNSDSINSALENSLSHSQPKIKKATMHHRVARKIRVKPRTLSISAAVMAFMVLGGFFAYNNAPNLSMRLAAMRSDVHGSLPGYQPAGFALSGPIKYEPGKITVAYKSNSDDRSYKITQSSSKWDTESLRENYINGLKTSYQSVQEKGKTIYLYSDASATWVDAGIWYKLDGDSHLNTDQVLHIASSL